ncbi:MAG: hypothetical protein PVH03_12460 [Chloroflexota bacterium]|jgi:hypothetical protein
MTTNKPSSDNYRIWLKLSGLAWFFILLLALITLIAGSPARLVFLEGDPYGFAGALEGLGLSTHFFAVYFTAIEIAFALLFMAVGLLIFWKASDDWMAILVSAAFISLGVGTPLSDALIFHDALWHWPVTFLRILSFNLALLMFFLFPDGLFVPSWTRWLALTAAFYTGLWFFIPELIPPIAVLAEATTLQALILYLPWIFLVMTGVAGQIYRYRHVSDSFQRQQTKWVVLGFTLFAVIGWAILLPFGLSTSIRQAEGGNILYILLAGPLLLLAVGLIPLTTALAILRYRLWDISLVVRKTITYGLLTVFLLAIYLIMVVIFEGLLRLITGQDSPLIIVVSTLLIAFLFNPLRTRLQTFIDHRFFRQKYNATITLRRFAETARDEVDLDQLAAEILQVVQETLQPERSSLWLRRVNEGQRNHEAVSVSTLAKMSPFENRQ